jgi:hypothetical protein
LPCRSDRAEKACANFRAYGKTPDEALGISGLGDPDGEWFIQRLRVTMQLPELGLGQPPQTSEEIAEENRKLRRLQVMMSMVTATISQDPNLTVEEAAELAAGAKRAALAMFPDKELAYDLIYRPRLQRLLNERFRLQ